MFSCHIVYLLMCIASIPVVSQELEDTEILTELSMPKHLFKILSLENWEASQSAPKVILSSNDDQFVHFSKEDQLPRVISKYWSDSSGFVILTIDTDKLLGEMLYETNPGGTAKYYHLYNGSIPSEAVVESQKICKDP